MPDIEELLREELKRTARKVQPEILRPLRAPAPHRGWRPRLVALSATAALIAIVAVVALIAGLSASPKPAISGPASAALPRFYVTISGGAHGNETEAVVRVSAGGQVTGTVQVPSIAQDVAFVTGAADDRSFIIGAYEGLNEDSSGGIRLDLRLFQFRISGGGKPGHLTELAPAPARGQGFQGIALSPDGKLLAVSLVSGPDDSTGTLQVINLATGTIRTWTAPVTGPQYAPGAPAWVDGNRMIAFTWLRSTAQGTGYATEGVRLLDIAAPGDNLADAKLIVPSGVVAAGSIKSALITPDGRDVIAVTLRDLSPLASSHTVIVQFAELQAGTGRLVRVLRTQTARLDQDNFTSLQYILGVLSFGSAGQYVLVQGIQFGWLEVGGPDPGRFTSLPLPSAVPFVSSAAW
jgi:hypothetical protein